VNASNKKLRQRSCQGFVGLEKNLRSAARLCGNPAPATRKAS